MPQPPNLVDLMSVYDSERSTYAELARRIKGLLEDLVSQRKISVHSVTARAKEPRSLKAKLEQHEPPYETLSSVTDLAGVRVTTYFSDDVDRIGELITREFEVDSAHSVDKRGALDPDRFGYLSLHYVVSLSTGRSNLPEYSPYRAKKCEIQVRSLLQHAWAEIEHDLGYKTAGEVPRTVRRRFSRVAGLLELVDLEFLGIRDELSAYRRDVPERIQNEPATVLLDAISFDVFTKTDPVVAELDAQILRKLDASSDGRSRSELIGDFALLGLSTVEHLRQALYSRKEYVHMFAETWIREKGNRRTTRAGISLFYLRYVLLAENGREFATRMLETHSEPERLVERIFDTFEQVRTR